ncbi:MULTISPECIES: FliM/FliN family flagellar motor C-terminal domain-containing protein [unclassified Novosphingobium]|uniref:FliM/FliN family flagellar motor switch protein n=1 Tax=unclassified Novosphingobium TaxID=2644732 RepID=UPI000EBD47F7|nr:MULTISPECIES: FliM/FliN family flagellar motor C-terminal domain-containing protein [unclassified Novosphingobium]HCF24398.1 flagellar motor switch protein FliM [Novosphingobium sp.]HQV03779.1 FliM/FliN family flagellar motor C-terminal domain-containing protein [Novosphingobium sp.]
MNTQHSFVAERAAAQHCAELLRGGPPPAELLPALARSGERIARALAPALAPLVGAETLEIEAGQPEQSDLADLIEAIGPLAANSLLASDTGGLSLLTSIDGAGALRLVDRAFGGRGELSGPLPDRFPLSAEMLIARIEDAVAAVLAEQLGLPDLGVLRRDCRIGDLAAFPAQARLAVLRLTIGEAGRKPWNLLAALPLEHLPRLLGTGGLERAAPRRTGSADPAAAPFAEMPLPLTATLVDMRVPLSALVALEPGMVLPVAVARAVPIAIGGAVLARGTIGSNDDRVAVKLTQIA